MLLAGIPCAAPAAVMSTPGKVVLHEQACPGETPKGRLCLRATVPENHAEPQGRQIGIDIVILKASAPKADTKPVFILEGGPGERATEAVEDELELWASLAQDHDLVLIDQRGTGKSPDLRCGTDGLDDGALFADLWPAMPLHRCADRLKESVDLTRYTTSDAARDFDAIRAALHYDKINLVAASYGTRLAQEYIRRYGDSVRAALLIGPVAPSSGVPAGFARSFENSMAMILERCMADSACAKAFPRIREEYAQVRQTIGTHGLPFTDAERKPRADYTISPGIVASYIRSATYSAAGATAVPAMIHALAAGDSGQKVAAKIAAWRRGFAGAAPWPLYTSIVCAEDVPFVDDAAERRDAAGTFLGTYRLDQQQAACRSWPRASLDPDFRRPLHSAVPMLVMVGELDPATPAREGEQVVGHMSNAKLLRIPNRSHGLFEEWGSCVGKIGASFLRNPVPDRLDTACVQQLTFPPFATALD